MAFNYYKDAGGNWTFKQYSKISTYAQRSFARGREASIRIDNKGNVIFDKWGPKYSKSGGSVTQNFFINDRDVIHTHAKWGGEFSVPDKSTHIDFYEAYPSSRLRLTVVGKQDIYFTDSSRQYNRTGSKPFVFPYITFLFGR